MSVSGNPMKDEHKGLVYQIFLRKGYVVLWLNRFTLSSISLNET